MDREISDQLTEQMPIVPHCAVPGVDCCGCISAAVEGTNVELRCNECGAVVGVVQLDILKGLLALECATGTCQHCGKKNAFPGFDQLIVYTCQHCGMAVEPQGREINDDTCQWYTFEGREPIAVMPCDRCGRHPDVDDDGVACPICGRRSPVRAGNIIEAIETWNGMVGPGE